MEAQAPSYPPVVAVVVTSDPGEWLEETLVALAAQEYPSLSVLVIDDGSATELAPRVAAVLPQAYVRRRAERGGFAVAANEVIEVVQGASHLLFCHDDVALEPAGITVLLEESFRWNAGIVGPKLVAWDDPRRLLQVGLTIDKFGTPSSNVERGELDQEQHDAVREVFVIPGGCQLIRADLFAALGGFDPLMTMYGEDIDLCWRAQVAGARMVVVPSASARHLEARTSGLQIGGSQSADPGSVRNDVRSLQVRHRLRSVLKNYSRLHLIRVLPQLLVLTVGELVVSLAAGRTQAARAIVASWTWNLRNLSTLRAARRALARQRQLPDSAVRRLQMRGSARLVGFIRGQLARPGRDLSTARQSLGAGLQDARWLLLGWSALVVVLLFGSRTLIGGRLATVGQLAPFPSAGVLLSHFFSGWRTTGLGSPAPAPTAFGLLGFGGAVLLGATAQLQKILVLGALPLGLAGVYRSARRLGSSRVALLATAAYAVVPLPYNAIARGRLGGLVAYAAAPWVLGQLFRLADSEPFPGTGGTLRRRAAHAHTSAGPSRWPGVLRVGIVLAVTGALAPSFPVVAIVVALAMVLGAVVTGSRPHGELRALTTLLGGVLVAAVLLLPWTLDMALPGGLSSTLFGSGRAAARGLSFGSAVRFQTGPVGSGVLGWAFAAAAILPLIVGSRWRLGLAAKCWVVALACWAVVWTGGRGWLGLPSPSADVILAPAAAALALSIGLGMAAFEHDVTGHRLGWRQYLSFAAAASVALATIPVLGAALDGRWNQPSQDFRSLLAFTNQDRSAGAFRVLWLGDGEVLPVEGWSLGSGLTYAATLGPQPTALDLLPPVDAGANGLLSSSVNLARRGFTSRLGHVLAPMAVRYVVVVQSLAPASAHTPVLAPPRDVEAALDAQTDLRPIAGDTNLLVYENSAWIPARAALQGPTAGIATAGANAPVTRDLAAVPVLPQGGHLTYRGRVTRGSNLFFSETSSGRWSLRVGGHRMARHDDFGWANGYRVDRSGRATLHYEAPVARMLAPLLELALWLIAALMLWRTRRERAQP